MDQSSIDFNASEGTCLIDDVLQNAPVVYTAIEELHGEYERSLQQIRQVAALFEGDIGGVVGYFLEGNRAEGDSYSSYLAANIFRLEPAIAALNARFWQRALALTDVYELMPQARRSEWNEAIQKMTTPPFERESVRETLTDLLDRRERFVAERIDGVFRALSRTHVTNSPSGFSTRMILTNVSRNLYHSHERQGEVHDLRCVIARFTGQKEPNRLSTFAIFNRIERLTCEWHSLDGGAMRVKMFKNGNCHIDVHPDMAYRLNSMLAMLYPMAIPSEFRTKSARVPKEFGELQRTIDNEVREWLAAMRDAQRTNWKAYVKAPFARYFEYGNRCEESARSEAEHILSAIGGVRCTHNSAVWWEFEYDPTAAINEIVISGRMPDEKASQYYPTPPALARLAVERAEIGPEDRVLEPSAGQGGLAAELPIERTTCVEINPLNVRVLTAKGFSTVEADFLAWAAKTEQRFERVVMNPPFSQGRAKLHLEAAARLLVPGGRLVAIVPGSMRSTNPVPDLIGHCEGQYKDLFQGTGACVSVYVATKPN